MRTSAPTDALLACAGKNAPRDCCQARRAAKQGMLNAHTNHRRAAAGGESKHNHKSAPAPVKSKPGFPSEWLPRVRGRSPGDLWLLSITGKQLVRRRNTPVLSPAGETPSPARRRNSPPSPHPQARNTSIHKKTGPAKSGAGFSLSKKWLRRFFAKLKTF